jgi:hypothetical protein
MLRERALMISDDDVTNVEMLKRLRARIVTQMLPPHRYDGILTLNDSEIAFDGRDLLDNNRFRLVIPLNSIIDIHLGYDERFIGKDSKGKSYQLLPIRVRYRADLTVKTVYIFPEYKGLFRSSSSEEVYKILLNLLNTERRSNQSIM